MHSKPVISHTLGMADHLLTSYVADLSDSEILLEPIEGMNHIAWQIGHLISSERMFAELVKPDASPALPEGFDDLHSRTDTRGTSPEQFHAKETYMALYKAQRDATNAILEAATDEELAASTGEKFAAYAPNVATLLNMIGLHYMMHLGQFVAVRRFTKKPIAV